MTALDGVLVAAELVEYIGAERVASVDVSDYTHTIGVQFHDAEDGNRAAAENRAKAKKTFPDSDLPFQTWESARDGWTVIWYGAYKPEVVTR
ncbi:hypothetical protein RDI86_01990 [Cellulosimicrobium sp. XJ-DQ-B-000]|uniref:hypothetical protein n=1 Tax=Cellulosimicrobium sp. XJ-DQ-B-000 TaxID=3072182 RepID=UPI0028097B31|nr:hypothetical protein [Cellulosimicrobium sp. XJ-DQ-B-000]MDQ8040618.1 hypothetical protein [Cellulosimicrobium sp. XJ-DQ-B-000]